MADLAKTGLITVVSRPRSVALSPVLATIARVAAAAAGSCAATAGRFPHPTLVSRPVAATVDVAAVDLSPGAATAIEAVLIINGAVLMTIVVAAVVLEAALTRIEADMIMTTTNKTSKKT